MSRTQFWVNAYEISQVYGGAEEGGWFFDVGTPIWSQQALCHCTGEYKYMDSGHSVSCPITALLVEANAFVQKLDTGWDAQFISRDPEEPEHRGERVYGKTAVRIEESPGHAYPDEYPHYE
tara:strand:- start:41 stop:403 length:363 start_codon:yes stop_codon:yes gene_type:complete